MTTATTPQPPQQTVRGLYPTTVGVTPQGLIGAAVGSSSNPSFIPVVFEEDHYDELEVTEHPMAQGAPITDHAYKRPAEVTLLIGFSESGDTQPPVAPSALQNIYTQLLQGQSNRVLYNVTTGKRLYTNMLIKIIALHTDKRTEHILRITVRMRQAILVESPSITSVPAAAGNQANPQVTQADANRGSVQTTAVSVPPTSLPPTIPAADLPNVNEIPMVAAPQVMQVALAGVTYSLACRWNKATQAWGMDIADALGNPLVSGIALTTGVDLLEQYAYLGIGGALSCASDFDPSMPPEFGNLGSTAHLYFTPPPS